MYHYSTLRKHTTTTTTTTAAAAAAAGSMYPNIRYDATCLQVAYLGPVAIGNAAFYAGGFEAGYFIRKPTTNTVCIRTHHHH